MEEDKIQGWQDYSEHVVEYDGPNKSATIGVKDGGYGDADGVANGVIVTVKVGSKVYSLKSNNCANIFARYYNSSSLRL